MAKGNDKHRAKKKQQKKVQRKQKLARRDGLAPAPKGYAAGQGRPVDLLKGWYPERQGIVGLAQRRKIALVDAAYYAELAQRENHPGSANLWTPARVAALSDEAILEKLAALGIRTDRESYLAATANDVSAMPHAAIPWSRAIPGTTPVIEADFVQIAALDLWRRFRPERPSREMLLVAHQSGWDLDFAQKPGEAIDRWLEFGDMIWRALPSARKMEDVDAVLNDPHVKLGAFYFDAFADMLAGVASEQAEQSTEGAVDRALRVAEYLRQIVERLPDTSRSRLEMLEGARSNLLDACGKRDEALAVLRGMIEAHPTRAAGYAMLSEALLDKDDVTLADFDEVIAVLRKGAAEAQDADEWLLQGRIEEMKSERAFVQSGGPAEIPSHGREDEG